MRYRYHRSRVGWQLEPLSDAPPDSELENEIRTSFPIDRLSDTKIILAQWPRYGRFVVLAETVPKAEFDVCVLAAEEFAAAKSNLFEVARQSLGALPVPDEVSRTQEEVWLAQPVKDRIGRKTFLLATSPQTPTAQPPRPREEKDATLQQTIADLFASQQQSTKRSQQLQLELATVHEALQSLQREQTKADLAARSLLTQLSNKIDGLARRPEPAPTVSWWRRIPRLVGFVMIAVILSIVATEPWRENSSEVRLGKIEEGVLSLNQVLIGSDPGRGALERPILAHIETVEGMAKEIVGTTAAIGTNVASLSETPNAAILSVLTKLSNDLAKLQSSVDDATNVANLDAAMKSVSAELSELQKSLNAHSTASGHPFHEHPAGRSMNIQPPS